MVYPDKEKMILIALMILVVTRCAEEKIDRVDEDSGKERYFVEGYLSITNAIAVNNLVRPEEFGLLTGNEYYLQYTASKYMTKVDGEMQINITLPEGIQKITGDTEWIGRDQTKTIRIKIIPIKEGNYQLTAMAKNLDNNFY